MTLPSRPDDLTLLTLFGIIRLQSTFPTDYPTNDNSTITLTTAYYVDMVSNVLFHLGRFQMPWSQTNAGRSNCCCGEEQPVGPACWVAVCMNLMPIIYQLCRMDEDKCTGRLEGGTLRWARRTKEKVAKSRHHRSPSLCLLSPWGVVHTFFMLSISAIPPFNL